MKAVELNGYEGTKSLRLVEVEKPRPKANEVLIEVRAAGVNYTEIELAKGRYYIPKQVPFRMGFQAAGVVVETGSQVNTLKEGDAITSIVSSGGYAEYATAEADVAIPIPDGISFAEAAQSLFKGSRHSLC